MSQIPASDDIRNAADHGTMQNLLEQQRDSIAQMLGGEPGSELTIAAGIVTPTHASHVIDTEGDASTDDLSNIAVTNHHQDRLLLLRAANASRDVVLKHGAGGSGQILLSGAVDFTLDSLERWILLKLSATNDWEEVARFYGNDKTGFRAFYGVEQVPAPTEYGQMTQANSGATGYQTFGPNIHGLRNALINGDFRLWMRHGVESDSGITLAATPGYTADRWYVQPQESTTIVTRKSFAAGQTAVPNGPRRYMNVSIQDNLATTRPRISQRVEGVRTLNGKGAVVSVYVKGTPGQSVYVGLRQYFGSGGSAAVTTAYSSTVLTASWQRITAAFSPVPSISGKTIGANRDDYLEVLIETDLGVIMEVDIADAQLERGGAATPFERRNDAIERTLAHRYFWKTMKEEIPARDDLFPTYFTDYSDGSLFGRILQDVGGNGYLCVHAILPTPMRVVPTVTLYRPDDPGVGDWEVILGDPVAGSAVASERSISVRGTAGVGASGNTPGNGYRTHVAVDAEL